MKSHRNVIATLSPILPLMAGCWLGGCIPAASQTELVVIGVVPGQSRTGDLYTGQTLRARVSVEAGHIYALQAAITPSVEASASTGDIIGTISGDPVGAPVEFPVSVITAGLEGTGTPTVFVPTADGTVTIEFLYPIATNSEGTTDLDILRSWINGSFHATYEVTVSDLGYDDNGQSPATASYLELGVENERIGTLAPGDDADYFRVQFAAGQSYRITLESSEAVTVVSGGEDRFGDVNFGIPTLAGLAINVSSSSGVPGSLDFISSANEVVYLRVTAFGGTGVPIDAEAGIEYAINIVETDGG